MMKFFPYILLGAIVFLLYGNTLRNGFVHDDVWQVEQNQSIRSFNVRKAVFGCVAEEILGGCSRGFYWRPLQPVMYTFIYQLSQKPWIFHLANLVYFWTAGCVVYLLGNDLTKNYWENSGNWRKKGNRCVILNLIQDPVLDSRLPSKGGPSFGWCGNDKVSLLPLAAAILFVANPVNSEAVNWVSASPELYLAIFVPLALILFIKYLKTSELRYLLFSNLAFFLALLSKESAVFLVLVLPFLISLIQTNHKRIKAKITILAIYLIPLGAYLLARTAVLGRVVYEYEGFWVLSAWEQIFTALALFPRYLLKLVYPFPLSFQPIIEPTRVINANVLTGVLVLLVYLAVFIFLLKKKLKIAAFGMIMILAGILPVLVFVNKLGEFVFSERYLLICSIGFSILATAGISRIYANLKRINANYLIWFALGIYSVGSWFVVFGRNGDWKDNEASFKSMIRVDPKNKEAYFHLGQTYQGEGRIELAKKQYITALGLDPGYEEAKMQADKIGNYFENDDFSFYFPKSLKLQEVKDKMNNGKTGVVLIDTLGEVRDLSKDSFSASRSMSATQNDGGFRIEINSDRVLTTYEQYLAVDDIPAGELTSQGPAQIPGTDFSYLRLWKDGKADFFLFFERKVIRIVVVPFDRKSKEVVDVILGTVRLK